MISVVIPTHDDEAVLARALAPLVAAVVSGLVREVILADGGSVDATLEIGEDAGCRILAAEGEGDMRVRTAAEGATAEWLLILPPEVLLLPGWETVVRGFLERQTTASASLAPIDPDARWFRRLMGRKCEPVLLVRRRAYLAGEAPPVRRMTGCAVVIGREG